MPSCPSVASDVLANARTRSGLVAIAILGIAAGSATAAFSSAASAAGGISSGSLAPPTGVAASCVALTNKVSITWTATTSALAQGYAVLRSSSSGGPYSLVGTVTGRGSTNFSDTIGLLQTQYYVVESTRDLWTSAISNQSGVHSVSLGVCTAA